MEWGVGGGRGAWGVLVCHIDSNYGFIINLEKIKIKKSS